MEWGNPVVENLLKKKQQKGQMSWERVSSKYARVGVGYG